MSPITLPLPDRAVSVVKNPFANPISSILGILIMLGLAAALTWWQGPGLWRDWQISQNPATLEDWSLIDGECNSRRGLTDCEASVTYTHKGRSYEKYISLAFFDISSGDYTVELIIARNDPELATLSLGLDMLWNRLIVFAIFMALFLGGGIATLLSVLAASKANRDARNPARLSVVPVTIAEMSDKRGATIVAYNYPLIGQDKQRQARTQFAKGEDALLGLNAKGEPVGVAVRLEGMVAPVLLDADLKRIDLSDRERQDALSAFHAEQEQSGQTLPQTTAPKNKAPSILRGLMVFLLILILAVVGVIGYWVYYVNAAPDAFDSIGIELNNLMPTPLNTWGCEQLYARFGDERAPYGCTADDHRSWLVAPADSKR